jgi:hypothetical protein
MSSGASPQCKTRTVITTDQCCYWPAYIQPHAPGTSVIEPWPIHIPTYRPRLVHSLVFIMVTPLSPLLIKTPTPYHCTIQRELGAPRSLQYSHHRFVHATRGAMHCYLPHHPECHPDYLWDLQRGRQNAGHVPSSKTCPHPAPPHPLYDTVAPCTCM